MAKKYPSFLALFYTVFLIFKSHYFPYPPLPILFHLLLNLFLLITKNSNQIYKSRTTQIRSERFTSMLEGNVREKNAVFPSNIVFGLFWLGGK